jgi:hypothetical protein
VFPQKQRNRRRSDEPTRRNVGRLRLRETCPADFARQAQHVEHARLVFLHPRRQHTPLPGAGGQFVAIERRHDRPQPVDPGHPMRSLDVLPREQESHEIRRADRLDLRPQPIERVAMNPRQQTPIAPL